MPSFTPLRKTLPALLLLAATALPTALPARAMSSTMSVEEAYQAIPRTYTPFDAGDARMREEERTYLSETFFPLLNEAVVARVEMLRWFQGAADGTPYVTYHATVGDILTRLHANPAPERLKKPIRLVEDAIRQQDAYFSDWLKTNDKKPHKSVDTAHADVVRSHRDLTLLYTLLTQQYPHESGRNLDAFYNTIAALDFVH